MGRGECLSVIDCAMEEGDMGECTRVLVRGAWRGSDGDVEGEVDPSEPPGTALDSWRDAAAAAALALALGLGGGLPTAATGTTPDITHSAAELPVRVLVIGLRCGTVPAFVCRHLPGVRVDVVVGWCTLKLVLKRMISALGMKLS